MHREQAEVEGAAEGAAEVEDEVVEVAVEVVLEVDGEAEVVLEVEVGVAEEGFQQEGVGDEAGFRRESWSKRYPTRLRTGITPIGLISSLYFLHRERYNLSINHGNLA